jgi:hypothetical protein
MPGGPDALADRDIRVIDLGGQHLRELTLDYQPATTNHSGKPDLSTMSRDICLRCPETSQSAPGGNRTLGLRLERPLLFGSPKRTVDH